jgi:tetratricopeptide (TPR) repeat protein
MPGDDKSRILRDAERFVLQGKVSQAVDEYLKIVKSDPNDVLTINTVGDLRLRQGKVEEANTYFSQVAEAYARNNFLLKSIAVYKKILRSDPENLGTNHTLAQLFAKQGLNADARNQYIRVAELCAREGRSRESVEAYEKVVELDPNNFAVQLKLAEIHLANGGSQKARSYYAGAARAQAKAGDLAGAVGSYHRALQLDPTDLAVTRGFFDTAVQLGDPKVALDQLEKSLLLLPGNPELLEMLGRTYLAMGNMEGAEKSFSEVVQNDATKYPLFFEVHRSFMDKGDLKSASESLDSIVPILISHRATERAVECYEAVLTVAPDHIPTWSRLAHLYSTTNEQDKCVEALDRLAALHFGRNCPGEALEVLEQILQFRPDSKKHLELHRRSFQDAFPGLPYAPPAQTVETPEARESFAQARSPIPLVGAESEQRTLVDVDLLLNYGMTEKALELLRTMEAADPSDKHVREKLVAIYAQQQNNRLAAEQCLLLAAEYRKSGDEDTTQKWLTDAEKLDAEFVSIKRDVLLPPLSSLGLGDSGAGKAVARAGSLEVDLSEDLSEIFFKDAREGASEVEESEGEQSEETVDEFTPVPHSRPALGSLGDQLQEVDFYIRLGFFAEAKNKLDEISRDYPGNTELPLRYRQISEGLSQQPPETDQEPAPANEPAQSSRGEGAGVFSDLQFELEEQNPPKTGAARAGLEVVAKPTNGSGSPAAPASSPPAFEVEASGGPASEIRSNAMFADLLDEVNALPEGESNADDFETHFSLGTAYREMGLVDEAIKEYQGAVKALIPSRSPREVIQCCGMLSMCYLEKGMPRSAVRWCESGLSIQTISPHEATALRYDMGVAFSLTGDTEKALGCFETIFGLDPGYRDVAQKIDELRGGPGQHAL